MEPISSGASTSKEMLTSQRSDAEILVRQCRVDDLDQVLRIENASFPKPYDRSLFSHFLSRGPQGFLIADKRGTIVGYVIATIERDFGLIISIAVSPDNRGRGIGTILMNTILAELSKKVRRVELQVSVNNKQAIQFYQKFSFKETGFIKNYYPNGDDAILMSREI